jgi:hypothetical protein
MKIHLESLERLDLDTRIREKIRSKRVKKMRNKSLYQKYN